jgi:hypothetical protein
MLGLLDLYFAEVGAGGWQPFGHRQVTIVDDPTLPPPDRFRPLSAALLDIPWKPFALAKPFVADEPVFDVPRLFVGGVVGGVAWLPFESRPPFTAEEVVVEPIRRFQSGLFPPWVPFEPRPPIADVVEALEPARRFQVGLFPPWQPWAQKPMLPPVEAEVLPPRKPLHPGTYQVIPPVVFTWFPLARKSMPGPPEEEIVFTQLRKAFLYLGTSFVSPWQPWAIKQMPGPIYVPPSQGLDEPPKRMLPPIIGTPPGQPAKPAPVGFDPMAPDRTRRHQQVVREILNSLIFQNELVNTKALTWDLGYTPSVIANWGYVPPVTVAEALDRIAAALVALGKIP